MCLCGWEVCKLFDRRECLFIMSVMFVSKRQFWLWSIDLFGFWPSITSPAKLYQCFTKCDYAPCTPLSRIRFWRATQTFPARIARILKLPFCSSRPNTNDKVFQICGLHSDDSSPDLRASTRETHLLSSIPLNTDSDNLSKWIIARPNYKPPHVVPLSFLAKKLPQTGQYL